MRFSTKTTYGLRALFHVAKAWPDGHVAISHIAQAEKLSAAYLERLFARLKKAKIITATQGVNGGYQLSVAPNQLTIYQVIAALEGQSDFFYCWLKDDKIYCKGGCACGVNDAMRKIDSAINNSLSAITLDKLIA
ncbi:MAG: Rrf2 family transcriptional regulator [Candidatus Falkowbacteria bacterium]